MECLCSFARREREPCNLRRTTTINGTSTTIRLSLILCLNRHRQRRLLLLNRHNHRPPPPTQPPAPPPTQPPTGVNGNPWGYNFVPSNLIYSPPASFCSYFSCINNFPNGRGYVEECQDGMYSKSGGIRGSCSYYGGDLQPLYSH